MIATTVGLVVGFGVHSLARADPPVAGDVEDRWRFGVDVDAAYWRGVFTRPDRTTVELEDSAFGVIGYRRVPVTMAFSRAFSDWVLCGARLGVEVEAYHPAGAPVLVDVHGNLGPFVEFLFLGRREVRPFVYFDTGAAVAKTFVASEDEDPRYELGSAHTLYPFVGAGLGAHAFVTDDLSLDAMIVGRHRWIYRDHRTPGGAVEDTSEEAAYRLRNGTLVLSAVLGLSRWF